MLRGASLLFVLGGALGACSRGPDRSVIDTPNYRRVNPGCAGLELPRAELDGAGFRKIVQCLNTEGALAEVAAMADRLSPRELDVFASTLSRAFVARPERVRALEHAYGELKARGLVPAALADLRHLIGQEEIILAQIEWLRAAAGGDAPHPDQLRLLQEMGRGWDADATSALLDEALDWSTAPAFGSLIARWEPGAPGRSADAILEPLVRYLGEDSRQPGYVDPVLALRSLAEGDRAFRWTDPLLGVGGRAPDAAALRARAARFADFFHRLGEADAGRLRAMLPLPRSLRGPVTCLDGGIAFPDLLTAALGEVARAPSAGAAMALIDGPARAQSALLRTSCSAPSGMLAALELIDSFRGGPARDVLFELARSAHGVRETAGGRRALEETLIAWVGDVGPRGDAGFARLLPLFAELSDRDAWADATLLFTTPELATRGRLATRLRSFTTPRAGLAGKSPYQVVRESILRAGVGPAVRVLRAWAFALSQSTDTDGAFEVAPLARRLRQVLWLSDAHPVVDATRELLEQAPANAEFFGVLLKLAGLPEFRASLRLLARMAADGRLETVTDALAGVFHKFGQGAGGPPIVATAEPPWKPARRHEWRAADLSPVGPAAAPVAGGALAAACARVASDWDWRRHSDPGYAAAARDFATCAWEGAGRAGDALGALSEAKGSDDRSVWGVLVDRGRSARLTGPEWGGLFTRWEGARADGTWRRAERAGALWLAPTPDPASGDRRSAIEAWLGWFGQARARAGTAWGRLTGLVAALLEHPAGGSALRDLHGWLGLETPARASARVAEPDRGLIERWVRSKEAGARCAPPADAAARAARVWEEYRGAVTNHERMPDGGRRMGWTFREARERLEPIYAKLRDPAAFTAERPALRPLTNVIRYFQPGRHFTPAYLGEVLVGLVGDRRLVTYFYPGEKQRRVRLVNGLDALEILIINADIELRGEHLGYQLLGRIGDAWGDLPAAQWPPEIRAKFARPGARPETLAEAVAGVHGLMKLARRLGFPQYPKCPPEAGVPADPGDPWLEAPDSLAFDVKAKVYNVTQILPYLDALLESGRLRVLRNLFFELRYSSPPASRGSDVGDRNNLSFVPMLARAGIMRGLGRIVEEHAAGAWTEEFYRAFVEAASRPENERLTDPLLRTAQGQRTLDAWIEPIFDRLPRGAPWDAFQRSLFHLARLALQTGTLPTLFEQVGEVLADPESVAYARARGRNFIEWLADPRVEGAVRAWAEVAPPEGKRRVGAWLTEELRRPGRATAMRDAIAVLRLTEPAAGSRHGFDDALDRARRLRDGREYAAAGGPAAESDLLALLESPSGRALRGTAADALRAGDLDRVAEAASAGEPRRLDAALRSLGEALERGELAPFWQRVEAVFEPRR